MENDIEQTRLLGGNVQDCTSCAYTNTKERVLSLEVERRVSHLGYQKHEHFLRRKNCLNRTSRTLKGTLFINHAHKDVENEMSPI